MAAEVSTCANCLFFVLLPKHKDPQTAAALDQPDKGLCRQGIPKTIAKHIDPLSDDGRWPTCFASEWCGQWSKKV